MLAMPISLPCQIARPKVISATSPNYSGVNTVVLGRAARSRANMAKRPRAMTVSYGHLRGRTLACLPYARRVTPQAVLSASAMCRPRPPSSSGVRERPPGVRGVAGWT
jgi:hypothetical protein